MSDESEFTAHDTPPEATPVADAPATPEPEAKEESPSFGDGAEDTLTQTLSKAYDEATKVEPETADDENSADEAEETAPKSEADETEPDGHQAPSIDPPQSWSADDRAKWSSIPPDVQQVIAERERQAHEQITRQGEAVAQLKPVTDLIENSPYAGQDIPQMLTGLVNAQAMLDQNPVEGLKWLADRYKIDLQQLVPQQQTGQDDGLGELFHDPRVDQLSNELGQYRQTIEQQSQEIQELRQFRQEHQQQTLQQRQSEAKQAIEAFAKDSPYFDELRNDIALEADFLRSKDPNLSVKDVLQKAYERALNNSPPVRSKIEADKQAKEREAEEKRLEKARKAAKSNVKTKTGTGRKQGDTWQETLERVADEIVA